MAINKLSIVVPCYNEEGNLHKLITEVEAVLNPYPFDYEIICVDDGSKDATFKVLKELSKTHTSLKGFALSRNFGHQIALLAGLEQASGDAILSMDGDLQHPPEVIKALISKYEEGYDIVNTRREYDASTSAFKKLSSQWFYRLINTISDIKIEPNSSDFRLMSRETVDAYLSLDEQNRFTRGLVSWIGFNQATVDYKTNKRFAGTSGYSLKKMISFAISGVTSMTSRPLRLSLYLGLFFFLIGFIYGIYALYQFFMGATISGWASILITVLVIGGVQLLILSIIGEYVSKIFDEAKARPLYFIKAKTDAGN